MIYVTVWLDVEKPDKSHETVLPRSFDFVPPAGSIKHKTHHMTWGIKYNNIHKKS